jgi:carbamate kinase
MSTNPTNANQALTETMRDSEVFVEVYCQLEVYEADPPCHEYVRAYIGDVGGFSSDDVERSLKKKGWLYRHDADRGGYSQWVCPACSNRATSTTN